MTYTTNDIQQLIGHIGNITQHIDVVVCIGTDKVLCDSLGPMVGTKLNNSMNSPMYIYGLCGSCLTAMNIADSFDTIRALHDNSTILAIDAGVGDSGQVGCIQVSDNGILPGLATNRVLPCVGDIGIVGIVSDRSMSQFYNDTPTIRSRVDNMCDIIVQAIHAVNAQSVM